MVMDLRAESTDGFPVRFTHGSRADEHKQNKQTTWTSLAAEIAGE
jgi:hypothetical protein